MVPKKGTDELRPILKSTECLHENPALQNGEPQVYEKSHKARRLDGVLRSERRVHACNDSLSPQEISEIQGRRSDLSVPGPPLWFGHSSQSIYKNSGSASGKSKNQRSSPVSLSGRLDDSRSGKPGSKPERSSHPQLAHREWLDGELPKVRVRGQSGQSVHRGHISNRRGNGIPSKHRQDSLIESLREFARHDVRTTRQFLVIWA